MKNAKIVEALESLKQFNDDDECISKLWDVAVDGVKPDPMTLEEVLADIRTYREFKPQPGCRYGRTISKIKGYGGKVEENGISMGKNDDDICYMKQGDGYYKTTYGTVVRGQSVNELMSRKSFDLLNNLIVYLDEVCREVGELADAEDLSGIGEAIGEIYDFDCKYYRRVNGAPQYRNWKPGELHDLIDEVILMEKGGDE